MIPAGQPDHLDTRDLRGERLYTARDFTWSMGELSEIEWCEAVGV
jgi:hypothetical protein